MPDDEKKIATFKAKKFQEQPFIDTLRPKAPTGDFKGGLVEPKGRRVGVSAPAPKEPTETIFAPDKTENYGIRDVAPADRK